MKLIQDHIEYLKDNPEGYWFKRKLYGYGWTPATREGWFVLVVYIAVVLAVAWFANTADPAQISTGEILGKASTCVKNHDWYEPLGYLAYQGR